MYNSNVLVSDLLRQELEVFCVVLIASTYD